MVVGSTRCRSPDEFEDAAGEPDQLVSPASVGLHPGVAVESPRRSVGQPNPGSHVAHLVVDDAEGFPSCPRGAAWM